MNKLLHRHLTFSTIFVNMPKMQQLANILGAKQKLLLIGLPPHITILANFEQLKLEMLETRDEILSGVDAELNRRCIGSQSQFDKEEILAKMDALHIDLLKRVDILGQNSATAVLWNSRVVLDDFADEFLVSDPDEDCPQPLTIVETSATKRRKFQFFYLAGKISCLPKEFVFPHMTLCTLITSLFCGNPCIKTLPFRFLKECNLKEKHLKRVFRKMRAMFDVVIEGTKKANAWTTVQTSGAWDVPIALHLYESVLPLFEYQTNNAGHNIHWNEQMSWRTVYNLYLKKGKKFTINLDGATADEEGVANDGGIVVIKPMEWLCFFFCFFSQVWEKVGT
jgi:hypothetical protein